jgi:membrane protein
MSWPPSSRWEARRDDSRGSSVSSDSLPSVIEETIARLPGWARTPAEVLFAAAQEFGNDRASRMSAAIAYRAVFALAPLLMILVAVLGAFLGSRAEAQVEILDTVESIAGPDVAAMLGDVITSATATANTAAVIGGLLLLWTASSLFLEMQRDLNDIFDTPVEEVSGVWPMVRTRGIAFLWSLGLGLILVATWVLNAVWRFLGDLLPDSMENLHGIVAFLGPVLSLLLLPLVFGIVFQSMTAIPVSWRAVWVGGSFTSVISIAAAYGVGWYFQVASEPTALGFTGSLVIVIFLAYFFSAVFLFGAEVTKVYSDRLEAAAAPQPKQPMYDDPQVLVSEPPAGIPQTAFMAFVIGIVVGWRRRRR